MKRRSIGKLYNNQSYNYCHKTFFLFEKLQFFFITLNYISFYTLSKTRIMLEI